jgi:hypothetical protein
MWLLIAKVAIMKDQFAKEVILLDLVMDSGDLQIPLKILRLVLTKILACKLFFSIIRGMFKDEEILGVCKMGYEGIQCSTCMEGYTRLGSFNCTQCPEFPVISFIGLFILLLALVVFVIRSTIANAKKKLKYHSAYLRILLNHLQIVSLISALSLDWTEQVNIQS